MSIESDRKHLITRVATARDRLAVLSSRTSNPVLLDRIRDADAIAAALESECHRVVTDNLKQRIEWQAGLVEQLAADVERDLD